VRARDAAPTPPKRHQIAAPTFFFPPTADCRSEISQFSARDRRGRGRAHEATASAMASTVHYKFKSQKDYDSVNFDGMFISVGDLKSAIVDKKGLGRDQACELLLTNAQTDEGAPLSFATPRDRSPRTPRDETNA
jgi:hypothetical protein